MSRTAPLSQYPPMCRAFRLATIETGIGQQEIADRIGEGLSRISRYYNDREASHAMVAKVARAYGLPALWFWAKAGYVEMPGSFAKWLASDDSVSEEAKRSLNHQYEVAQVVHAERLGKTPPGIVRSATAG